MPNIIIFSADGINARNMSAYGYERPTTPFIESIIDDALVFENAFTNSGPTTGSIASLLTGKSPLTTRVIYWPDMLRGIHQTEHFVGLLKELGYTTVDISVREYSDPRSLSMKNAFDLTTTNFTNKGLFPVERALDKLREVLPSSLANEKYFFELTASRLQGRIYHALGLRNLNNPFWEVTNPKAGRLSDSRRMQYVRHFIVSANEPWFLNVHLMDSHGPKFLLTSRKFSQGLEQTGKWMTDFYDDAIRLFDLRVQELFYRLRETGEDKNTIVIVTSDHGIRWSTYERIPLIIFFPDKFRAGRVQANVQRLDLPPTVLEYLGIDRPAWMEGQSILTDGPDPKRKIVSTMPRKLKKTTGGRRATDYHPPFFSFGRLDIIQCQFWFGLPLNNEGPSSPDSLKRKTISGHTAPCDDDQSSSDTEIYDFMVSLLVENGYPDVSSSPGVQP